MDKVNLMKFGKLRKNAKKQGDKYESVYYQGCTWHHSESQECWRRLELEPEIAVNGTGVKDATLMPAKRKWFGAYEFADTTKQHLVQQVL